MGAKNYYESINYYDFTSAYNEAPTLIGCYVGGSPLHHMTDEQLVALSMKQLALIFNTTAAGNIPQKPVAYYVTRWKEDPYTQGSYTVIPPEAALEDIDVLGEQINNQIFFAGEGTSPHFGTTYGAILSGLDAASEINPQASLFNGSCAKK